MATVGALKDAILAQAGVSNHFAYIELSEDHRSLWEELNQVEYDRGYDPVEYEKPGSPQLRDMDLLTAAEFATYKTRAEAL